MRIPNDEQCVLIVEEMIEIYESTGEITDWEFSFCDSNRGRKHFTDKQKEVIHKFTDKYNLRCMRGY